MMLTSLCRSCNIPYHQSMCVLLIFAAFQTVHEGRIYQLKLFCDKDYPEKPPSVRFHSRINMTCVNPETGVVMLPYYSVEFVHNLLNSSYYTIDFPFDLNTCCPVSSGCHKHSTCGLFKD